jgi:hypothetical protein
VNEGPNILPDGRAAGWLNFTNTKNFIQARVRDQDLLHRIFDSVRVVTVDTHGCATARKSMKLKAPRARTLLPAEATEVSICYFDQDQELRTSASDLRRVVLHRVRQGVAYRRGHGPTGLRVDHDQHTELFGPAAVHPLDDARHRDSIDGRNLGPDELDDSIDRTNRVATSHQRVGSGSHCSSSLNPPRVIIRGARTG